MLLAEGKLADGPDLGVGLQSLPVGLAQGTALEGDDWWRRLRVVGDRGPALGAEDAVHGLAGRASLGVALGRAGDGELVLRDDDYEGVSRARLTLTVVAVVVPDDEGIRIDGVLDGAAKAVT